MPENSTAKSHPRISVVMPLYNAAPFVGEALESIRAQTLPVEDVIVVDDGSTDTGAEIAASFSCVTLIRKAHSGIGKTLNLGLARATGDYLSFLDADDRWLPQKTAAQMAALQADPQLDMVFGYSSRFRRLDREGIASEEVIDIVRGLSKGCLLIRSASFHKAGLFPDRGGEHDFMSWYFRAMEINLRSTMLSDVVTERRIHDRNHGILNKDSQRQAYFATLKASLERRRAAQDSVEARH
jgi:glycosyltransferase involved in cell wall biosynthesis